MIQILARRLFIRVDYFILSSFFLAFIASGLLLFQTVQAHQTHETIVRERLKEEAARLNRELYSTFGYLSRISMLIGEKIEKSNVDNLETIHRILSDTYFASKNSSDLFSWTLFDWTNAEGKMVVSTMHGALNAPVDKSFRTYTQRAPAAPWILHFDAPDIGTTSGQWVIPSGLGVQNLSALLIAEVIFVKGVECGEGFLQGFWRDEEFFEKDAVSQIEEREDPFFCGRRGLEVSMPL